MYELNSNSFTTQNRTIVPFASSAWFDSPQNESSSSPGPPYHVTFPQGQRTNQPCDNKPTGSSVSQILTVLTVRKDVWVCQEGIVLKWYDYGQKLLETSFPTYIRAVLRLKRQRHLHRDDGNTGSCWDGSGQAEPQKGPQIFRIYETYVSYEQSNYWGTRFWPTVYPLYPCGSTVYISRLALWISTERWCVLSPLQDENMGASDYQCGHDGKKILLHNYTI